MLLGGKEGETFSQVKICDFGLYQKGKGRGDVKSKTNGDIVCRAPEAILHSCYSKKSDVFSFGILLWELNCREVPWKGLSFIEISKAVSGGKRPAFGEHSICSEELKEVMEECWSQKEEERPSFSSILERLEKLVKSAPSDSVILASGGKLVPKVASENSQIVQQPLPYSDILHSRVIQCHYSFPLAFHSFIY